MRFFMSALLTAGHSLLYPDLSLRGSFLNRS